MASGLKEIERRTVNDLSYEEFVVEYMAKNKPVIIQGCTEDWRCAHDWVTEDGKVDGASLVSEFGKSAVQVTDTCRKYNGCGPEEIMSVAEYFVWFFIRGQKELKYLKDWNCAAEAGDKKFYQLPHYFQEDWLNEYCDSLTASFNNETIGPTDGESSPLPKHKDPSSQDYRFVYVGPKGSWTPLHADVLRSFSWSTNVCGRKRWLILPPNLTSLTYDQHGKHMAPDFTLEGTTIPDGTFFNLASAAECAIECIQEAGESIFIPCGWHHSVENLEDTLSVNHNWINGFGLHWTWALVKQKTQVARMMIEDCRSTCSPDEFEELIHKNTKADCGMDIPSFWSFLKFKMNKEVGQLGNGQGLERFHLLRLKQIERVLLDMQKCEDAQTACPELDADISAFGSILAESHPSNYLQQQTCKSQPTRLDLSLLPNQLSVVQLPPNWEGEPWWINSDFISVTKTPDELSIVCDQKLVPPGVIVEPGFNCLKVKGPLDFSQVGILADLSGELAKAQISVFAVSTFDTDYIMVRGRDVVKAIQVLELNGHRVRF